MRIVLGVGGGVAAYKSVHLLRLLRAAGHHVTPILTQSAMEFVGMATFSSLASEPAKTSLFRDVDPIPHTHLGKSTDLLLIAPATADLIGKIAGGLADDLLTATAMATKAPIALAPAMHEEMWENFALRRNVSMLEREGYIIVPPSFGSLAAGDTGVGRMAEPEVILDFVMARLSPEFLPLLEKKIVVSAGGTREAIDPVRYIGNRSSGKQGLAFAKVAAAWGGDVTLVTTVPAPSFPRVKQVVVESALEMEAAMLDEINDADIVVMAAAVADFRPEEKSAGKIKREGRHGLSVDMVANPDILSELVGKKPSKCVLVGFAAETEDLERNVALKLEKKGVELIVGNDVGRPGAGFEGDSNSVLIQTRSGIRRNLEDVSKTKVAEVVLSMATSISEL